MSIMNMSRMRIRMRIGGEIFEMIRVRGLMHYFVSKLAALVFCTFGTDNR